VEGLSFFLSDLEHPMHLRLVEVLEFLEVILLGNSALEVESGSGSESGGKEKIDRCWKDEGGRWSDSMSGVSAFLLQTAGETQNLSVRSDQIQLLHLELQRQHSTRK